MAVVESHATDARGVKVKATRLKFSSALSGAVFALLGCTSVVAHADGLVARLNQLPARERATLQAAVAEQKRTDPKSFAAIRELKGYRPEHYRQFRNPIPQVGPELRHLGKAALLPMLEALVLDAPELAGATDDERHAVIEGMLSEVGRLRDARSAPALRLAFVAAPSASLLRAAGRALGRLGDAASRGVLTASLNEPSRRLAAIDGLGECRSSEAARALAKELDAATSKNDAASLVRALGNLGSSWAWQALGAARQAEGNDTREVAASALVRSYHRFDGETRAAYRSALTMVESADTGRIVLAHKRGFDEATAQELEAVVKTIAARQGQ